jgi:hypothetical protein
VREGGLLGQSPPHSAPANVARFSPDGSQIISGGDVQRLRLWDAETLHPAAEPQRLDAAIDDARFLDDGRVIRVRLEDDRTPTFALTRAGSLNGAGPPPDLELFTGPASGPALQADLARWLGEAPTLLQPAPHGAVELVPLVWAGGGSWRKILCARQGPLSDFVACAVSAHSSGKTIIQTFKPVGPRAGAPDGIRCRFGPRAGGRPAWP